jgi:hypothetical protein
MNIGPSSQSSWRAHGFHSSKPSMRRQPLRVTSRWCLLEKSLVPQSSRTHKSSTRISHSHNGSRNTCVRKERALKSQARCWNGQESYLAWVGRVFIAHTAKASRWEDSAHFAVRLQYNSRSDHHNGNSYFSKNQSLEELVVRLLLVVVRPPWNRGWWSDQSLVAVWPPGLDSATEIQFSNEKIIQGFQWFISLWTKEKNCGAHLEFSQE